MAVDVTPIFAAHLARNRGPTAGDPSARERPDYGVSARLDGTSVELTLSFRAGAAYCCYEWRCHLALREDERWAWLRREFAAGGVAAPARLQLRLSVEVEAGALFFDGARPIPGPRGRYALSPSEAVRYETVVAEADDADAEPSAPARNRS